MPRCGPLGRCDEYEVRNPSFYDHGKVIARTMSTSSLSKVRLDFLRNSLADRYAMEAFLGKGAFASVYLIHNRRLERLEALKVLSETHDGNTNLARRFVEEAKLVASLDHPNIVKVYDYGEVDGIIWCAMQYIDGPTLRDEITERHRFEPRAAASLVLPLLDALDYSHARGVVHRDIKPSNIILDRRGRPFLMDFGIAKSLQSTTRTLTGSIMGTPLYIAPEHVAGESTDGRSDLYSLSTTLYEMIAGVTPFDSRNVMQAMMRRLEENPEPLSTHRPDIEPRLEELILRGLARDRDSRFSTAGRMRRALFDEIGSDWERAKFPPLAEAPRHQKLEADSTVPVLPPTEISPADSRGHASPPPALSPPAKDLASPDTPTTLIQRREQGQNRRGWPLVFGFILLPLLGFLAWAIIDETAGSSSSARRDQAETPAPSSAAPPLGRVNTGSPSESPVAASPELPKNTARTEDSGPPEDTELRHSSAPEEALEETAKGSGPAAEEAGAVASPSPSQPAIDRPSQPAARQKAVSTDQPPRDAPPTRVLPPPRQAVTPPRILSQVEPSLDTEDAALCAGTSVVLTLKVDTVGQVSSTKVLRGVGARCDQAAKEAAFGYRFRPALDQEGNPIGGSVTLNVQFAAPNTAATSPGDQ